MCSRVKNNILYQKINKFDPFLHNNCDMVFRFFFLENCLFWPPHAQAVTLYLLGPIHTNNALTSQLLSLYIPFTFRHIKSVLYYVKLATCSMGMTRCLITTIHLGVESNVESNFYIKN